MKQLLSLSLLVCLVLVGCKSQDTASKSSKKTEIALENTKWVLEKLNGDPVNLSMAELEMPFIKLNASEGTINGNSGCNSFGGNYLLSDKKTIQISQIKATLRHCEDLGIESVFMSNLKKAKTFKVSKKELSFKDDNGYDLLTFVPNKEN